MHEVRMKVVVAASLVICLSAASQAQSPMTMTHQQSALAMSRDEIASYAKIHLAIGKVRDSVQLALGLAENNPDKPAQDLRAHLRKRVAEILAANGMSDEQFHRETFLLSSDDQTRAVFDTVVS